MANGENKDVEEARALLAAIVDSTDDAIVSKDLNGKILSWNAAAERLFGYKAEEIVGQSIQKLMPAVRAEDFSSILDRIRRGERVGHYETIRKRKDGSLVEVSLTVSPIYGKDGKVIGASKIARDLTELRHVQREQERTRQLFLATLGHDLRNPLNTIVVSLAHLIGRIPEDLQEVPKRGMASANRMARMIEQLLDFTRARMGGGMPIVLKPGDLLEICQTVIDEFQLQYPNRVRFSAIGDFQGQWDADRIAQVLGNLLANAFDHGSPDAPVEVELTREGKMARIEVRNQGKTIPEDARKEVFEPFRRVDSKTSRGTRGLGLGLFITREIVHAHGGTITLVSEDGHTTVTVRLPDLVETDPEASRSPLDAMSVKSNS
jgi:two-component system, OmpR family, sensor histidine kinase VicK